MNKTPFRALSIVVRHKMHTAGLRYSPGVGHLPTIFKTLEYKLLKDTLGGQISRAAGWRYSGDRELRRDVYATATPVCLDELDALEKAKLGSVRGSEWL